MTRIRKFTLSAVVVALVATGSAAIYAQGAGRAAGPGGFGGPGGPGGRGFAAGFALGSSI